MSLSKIAHVMETLASRDGVTLGGATYNAHVASKRDAEHIACELADALGGTVMPESAQSWYVVAVKRDSSHVFVHYRRG